MADEIALAPADGVSVVWDRDALAAVAGADRDDRPWRLEGELAPGFTALRVVSGATGEGSLLALCAVRPADAAHHDDELVAAAVLDPEGTTEISEALLSTEYGADGSIRRLGLELYKPEGDYPVRAAGDARESSSTQRDGEERRTAVLDFRLDGAAGSAIYEIVERA